LGFNALVETLYGQNVDKQSVEPHAFFMGFECYFWSILDGQCKGMLDCDYFVSSCAVVKRLPIADEAEFDRVHTRFKPSWLGS